MADGFRAQVRSNDGSVWVNGMFAFDRKRAEADAQRLVDLFGNETRVIEQPDPLEPLIGPRTADG